MSLQAYLYDQATSAWTYPGQDPVPVDPDPDPEGNPGTGWWPSDLTSPLSLTALKDQDNFGPPPDYTFPNTMPAADVASSGITDFTGYHFTGLAATGGVMYSFSDRTFTNCLWDDFPAFGLGASDVLLDHCASRKTVVVSGASNIRYTMHRMTGMPGTDVIHITNDRSGHAKPVDITFDGVWAVGTKESYIVGANHMDTVQVRGCDRVVIHNFCFDHGTTFDTLFNATVFIENANGGSDKVLVNNGYSRSQGYRHMMMFGTDQQISNTWFADTGQNLLHDGGTGQVIAVQYGNKWETGTPILDLYGA